MKFTLQTYSRPKIILIIIFTILFALVIVIAYKYLPIGVDFHGTFRPAPLAILKGESPYEGYGFFYPPWTLLPLLPIALLPEKIGNIIFFFACLVSYIFILHRLKANLITTLIFIVSPPVLVDLWSLNINWLVMLGYLMPPQIGLFFVLIKPQVGGVMALFWFVEAWRKGGLHQVVFTFMPLVVITLLSLLVYPGWYQKASIAIGGAANISFWPLSIPFGLVLISLALRLRKERFAYMASPFLSPYFAINSLSTVLLGLVPSVWETLAGVGGMWIAIIITQLVR